MTGFPCLFHEAVHRLTFYWCPGRHRTFRELRLRVRLHPTRWSVAASEEAEIQATGLPSLSSQSDLRAGATAHANDRKHGQLGHLLQRLHRIVNITCHDNQLDQPTVS